jgi:valyl-tRNA synthetase
MIMAGYEYMGELPFQERLFHRHHPRQTGPQDVQVARQLARPAGTHRQVRRRRPALRRHAQRAARSGHLFDERTSSSAATSATSSGTPAASARCRAARSRPRSTRALLSSDDKWILLRLNTRPSANRPSPSKEYRFSDATATLYRFFWSEYCDWYIEASKAAFPAPMRRARPTPSPSSTSSSATRCGCSTRSCPSSPRSCGTAWASTQDLPETRAARAS